jgi:glycosyltransferase involved in cell wall biosynthesis
MACGVPVVVSDKGSLPEVVEEVGIKIDPYKPESIAEGVSKVLSLSSLEYNRLKEKCLEQASKFSWEKTALKTLEILESTIK